MADNCTALASRTSFAAYVALMRNVTSQDLTVKAMMPCRQQICSVLYGVGNADISGIGVIIGYALELLLGVLLSVALVTTVAESGNSSRLRSALSYGFASYADAAILLTFSVQLASLIILIRKDFGISAADFGSLTMEVTWAAALLTMLPMTLLCYIHEDISAGESQVEDRRDLRLIIVCISWGMFLYTFISRTIANYGPSEIGVPHPGAPPPILSVTEANNIVLLCYEGSGGLSRPENLAFQVFAFGGSLFVSIAILGALGWTLADRYESTWLRTIEDAWIARRLSSTAARNWVIGLVALWAIPQLWAIARFRSIQQALARSIGSSDYDNSWSFGQIVALVVFLPVVIELGFVYAKSDPYSTASGGHNMSIGRK